MCVPRDAATFRSLPALRRYIFATSAEQVARPRSAREGGMADQSRPALLGDTRDWFTTETLASRSRSPTA